MSSGHHDELSQGRDNGLAPEISHYARPGTFYLLATAIPWALWLIAGYLSRTQGPSPGVTWAISALALAGLLAPVGVAVVLVTRDPFLRLDVWRRLVLVRDVPVWVWLLALLLLPISLLVATAVSVPLGYPLEQFQFSKSASFSTGAIPPLVTLIGAAVAEELAWHSYGTDALVSRWSVWRSSIIFAVIWGVWHAPLSTIQGFYQAEVVETGWLTSINFVASLFPFIILMNWLYYRGGRSIILAIVFHAVANVGNELFQTHPDTKAIQTLLLILVCVVVVRRERKLFFSKPAK